MKICLFFLSILLISSSSLLFAEESITITTYYPSPYGDYNVLRTHSDAYLATDGGNVGIGTTGPLARLDLRGQVRIADGTQGTNKVLTSDANGLASWQAGGAPCIRHTFTADRGYQECEAGYMIPMAPLNPSDTSGAFLCCKYQ